MSSGKRKRGAHDRVTLNVGGERFESSVSTLTGSSSYFARLFSETWSDTADERAEYFLDRDPDAFRVVLSCMRYGSADPLPAADPTLCKRVLLEAQYLGVERLLETVKAAAYRNLRKEHDAGSGASSSAEPPEPAPERAAPDAISAHVEPLPLTDAEAAARFDAELGGVEGALRAGVLPQRFFAPRRPSRTTPRVTQLIPAGPTDTAFFNNDEDFQCRVVCYALVERADGATHIDAVIARGPEEELEDGSQLQLASAYRQEQQLDTWAMRPVGEVTYTLERVAERTSTHEADEEERLAGVNDKAESGFVVRHVLPGAAGSGSYDVLMERTAPL